MANANKVVINRPDGEEVLIDISGDSVTPETLGKGVTAHDKTGAEITGTMPTDAVRYGTQTLTEEQKAQARVNIGLAFEQIQSTADELEEYNLITLATEVSTIEELHSYDGVAILKGHRQAYSGVEATANYNVIKIPVAQGDVIRAKIATWWNFYNHNATYYWMGFYTATGAKNGDTIVLKWDGRDDSNYLDYRNNGCIVPSNTAYVIVNQYYIYRYNVETTATNGLTAEIITKNADASLTAYDGTAIAPDYVPVADRGEIITYYRAVDDLRIPRYEQALEDIKPPETPNDVAETLEEITRNMERKTVWEDGGVSLVDQEACEFGYISDYGLSGDSTSIKHTPHISVSEGDVIRFYRSDVGTTVVELKNIRFLTAYDANGNVVPNAGLNNTGTSYTVPSGIATIVISFSGVYLWTFTRNKEITVYTPYDPNAVRGEVTSYVAKTEFVGMASETKAGLVRMWTEELDGETVLHISTEGV